MSLGPTSVVNDKTGISLAKGVPIWGIAFTRNGLRRWGCQSVTSLLDQGLTSGATFGVNVLLARWMPTADYGAFAIAFAGCLFISGFHNVLLLEPLSVIGPSNYATRLVEYFRTQLAIHFILIGVLSLAMLLAGVILSRATVQGSLGGAVLGSSLALPFLLMLWLARRMCYVAERPAVAVLGSATHLCLVTAGMFLLYRFWQVTAFEAFLLIGFGSGLAACLVLRKLGVGRMSRTICPRIPWATVLRQNWNYGRWLTLTTLLSWVSGQTQVLLTASLLGLTAAGILRAMQLPSLALTQVISATTLLVLPSLARELGQGNLRRLCRKAELTSFFLTAAGGLFVLLLILFSEPLERLLYAGRYHSTAWMIPMLGLAPVCTGFCSSLSYALRALGKSKYEIRAYVLSALTAVASSAVYLPRWGLKGGCASIVLTAGALAVSIFVIYKRWGVRERRQEQQAVPTS